jgi:hypothetical protein
MEAEVKETDIMSVKMKRYTGKVLVIAICMIALVMVLPPVGAALQVDITVDDPTTIGIDYHTVIVDGGPGDTDGVVNGQVLLGNNFQPITGFIVQGSFHTSTHAPFGSSNVLTSGSSAVTNTRASPTHATVAVSDTDFEPRAWVAGVTGSGTFTGAIGSTMTNNWYDDPANVQGANTDDGNPIPPDVGGVLTPGNQIDSFSFTAMTIVDSYSYNNPSIVVSDVDPYSMTLYFDFTLTPNGQLTSRGQVEAKEHVVPEFPTLAIPAAMVIGLLGAVMFVRKTREE